jgi:hypothetical protein
MINGRMVGYHDHGNAHRRTSNAIVAITRLRTSVPAGVRAICTIHSSRVRLFHTTMGASVG